MANTIQIKRGTRTPTTSNLTKIGEMAVDYSAGKVYIRTSSSVICINSSSSSGGGTTTGGSR